MLEYSIEITKLIENQKYKVQNIFLNEEKQLSLHIIKVKDIGYNHDDRLTTNELNEIKKILEVYYDKTVLIDYINRLIVFK